MTSRFTAEERAYLRSLDGTARELVKAIANLRRHHSDDELELVGMPPELLTRAVDIANHFATRAKELLEQ